MPKKQLDDITQNQSPSSTEQKTESAATGYTPSEEEIQAYLATLPPNPMGNEKGARMAAIGVLRERGGTNTQPKAEPTESAATGYIPSEEEIQAYLETQPKNPMGSEKGARMAAIGVLRERGPSTTTTQTAKTTDNNVPPPPPALITDEQKLARGWKLTSNGTLRPPEPPSRKPATAEAQTTETATPTVAPPPIPEAIIAEAQAIGAESATTKKSTTIGGAIHKLSKITGWVK